MRAATLRWILAAIFVVGLGLRLRHLDTTPPPLETADEFAWTWAGMSLLRTGVPQSWSFLDAYPNGVARSFHGHTLKIVSPWLDHPPLFAVLMGAWVHAIGYHDPYALSVRAMRWVPIALWILTFALLAFVLARLLEPLHTALAMVVFSVAPPMVIQSRLVIAESLIVPLALTAYWLLSQHIEKPSRGRLAGVAACTLTLPLTKIAALSLSCWLLIVALRRRAWWAAGLIAVTTAAALALYAAYGAHFGWSQFSSVQQAHAGRFVGFNSGLILLVSTHIVESGLIYPLFLLALVGAFIDVHADRGVDFYLGALVYAACMTFFADQRSVYGWYWLPLYPMFAAGAAAFFIHAWRRDDVLFHAVAAVALVPWVLNIALELDWDRRQSLRFVYFGIMVAVAAALLWPRRRLLAARIVLVAVFAAQIGADLLVDVRR